MRRSRPARFGAPATALGSAAAACFSASTFASSTRICSLSWTTSRYRSLERAEVDVLLLGQLAQVLFLVGGDLTLLRLKLLAQIPELRPEELRGAGRRLFALAPVLLDVERGQRVGHAGGHRGVGRRVGDG